MIWLRIDIPSKVVGPNILYLIRLSYFMYSFVNISCGDGDLTYVVEGKITGNEKKEVYVNKEFKY